MSESSAGEPGGDRSGTGGPRRDSKTWARVEAVFGEALALGPEARDELLGRVAAHDPALAEQVRSLLASHDRAGDFLDTPVVPALPPSLGAGDRLGPYRVVEEIGRGGMGVVYRAVRDDEHFTKEVAIKVIEPGMRSEGILKRFRSERQILAMLDHPHVARLVDGGTAPDGSPYLVMEHVTGLPLLQYCDRRGMGIEERLRLFLLVCDAVAFAHQRLVVHRDLKSDNILVTADGAPKLLDFGIARILSQEPGEEAATITAPLQRMLTPDYASPEQVGGAPVTVASDVYSLGVVLYELLTGTRPLRFKTRTAEEILRVVTQEEPPAPSAEVSRAPSDEAASRRGTTPARLRRRLAGDLDYVTLKALEKDPSRRYGSVDQLAHDLRRHLEDLPVLTRGGGTAYLVSRLVRRHRVAVTTGAVVLASLLVGLAGTAWQAHVAGLERDRARRRFEDVRALAHAVVWDIHDSIAQLPGATRAREAIVLHALRYLDQLKLEAGDDPSLLHEMGVAYGKIGDVQGRPEFPNLGRSADALRSYRRSLDILQEASRAAPESLEFSRDLVLTMQRLGDLLGQMGRKDEATKLNEDARRRILAELARYPESEVLPGDLGVACDRISDLRLAAGDTLGALKESLEGKRVATEHWRKNPQDPNRRRSLMVGHAKSAQLRAMVGDRAGAARDYRRSQELALECRRALPSNTDAARDLGVVYGMRALFLAEAGEIDSALALYAEATRIAEALAAADPSDMLQQADLARGRFEVGIVLTKGRRHREAAERFEDAFRRFSSLAARDSGNVGLRVGMARSSREAGDSCRMLAERARTAEERSRWRSQAAGWYSRSLDLYRSLSAAGTLAAAEAGAAEVVSRLLAEVR